MAQDTPRTLYVLLLAATVFLAAVAVGNSARADDAQPLPDCGATFGGMPVMPCGNIIGIICAPCDGPASNAYRDQLAAESALKAAGLTPIVYGGAVLPDPAKTPGAVYPDDKATICGKVNGLTYEKRSRASLTQAMKNAITRSYGQEPGQDGDHELDHRVPAALGGKSDASNVWWQPGRGHGTVWDFHVKDLMDGWAWRQVCVKHAVPLAVAQGWFMEADWTKVYCREMGGPPCKP